MANVSGGIFTEKTKRQEENFLRHVMQQDILNAMAIDLIKPGIGVPVDQLSGRGVIFPPRHSVINPLGSASGGMAYGYGKSGSSSGMVIGNVVPVMTPQERFFYNYDHHLGHVPTLTTNSTTMATPQTRSTSMLHDFLTDDLSKCSLDQLMAYSAFMRLVMSEFKDYDLDVPEEFEKRFRVIGREITRAIEQQIEQLEAEEKELQKREEKREILRQKREKLQQALE